MKMAQNLGHVKTRSLRNGVKNVQKYEGQIFKFLIVIDFEATCWKERGESSEIIEFPAVLFNTETAQILDTFHTYVQPTEQPVLSNFCKNLTGITQDQVDSGMPIGTALMLFNTWLEKKKSDLNFVINEIMEGKACCTLVTWTDWDFNICLANECRRKGLRKLPCFNAWADLKCIYKKFYERQPQGLNGALQDLGLKFDGREHCGKADAENTAKLAGKMIGDGCVVVITKSVPGGAKFVNPRLLNMSVNSAVNK